jgi:hypothetical protein
VRRLSAPPSAPGTWIAWAVFVATSAVWALAMLLDWLARGASSRSELGPYDVVGLIVALLLLSFPVTGLVIATRRPTTPIGWLLLAIGLGWGLLLGTEAYGDYGLSAHPGSLPAPEFIVAFNSAVWAIPVGLLGTFLLLLFPDGHLPGPRWRWVAYSAAFCIAATVAVSLVQPGGMTDAGFPHTRNPLGIESMAGILSVAEAIVLPLALTMVASAMSLVVRYRRSASTLLVAAAFQPLRTRIQRAVDHRFYRSRYDAARTLEAFSGRLREQVDLETVTDEVLGVVRHTLRPAHATLWLQPPRAGR